MRWRALTSGRTGQVWWAGAALEEALREAQRAFPLETGGLLLGWSTCPGSVVITQVIGPGPDATHRSTSFTPDAAWQEAQLADAYEQAGRRLQYLGDWHTHPRGTARLSSTDRATLRRIAAHADARAPYPVMALLAGGPLWQVVVRQQIRRRRPLWRLTLEVWQ
ncbi:Mov34/MPN/PAD-1 family protein [Blastococcus goldschmidtiae]|uniref:Mov34/MPN/PAD-1 family protein n=1 Tax=Blastococcus goldschmidtiae TaxID=3075546 RepID=A0ABU2K5R8_9ACTN|nr:Mov34/MPN/PAD-1 family protein [Blastococcus sp. DSM 46792]MDT0275541.1 Mov34/MPN/PAD-1 family protein [Blastococcus sp. DSM 46792]